ncbi:YhcN/YlaJ family sporulation lipoprotein [Bacillus shivajii]|uniref:YhcN/YlaJ family sporulation lipoprotein n=1 Tax=Bacillus shivajii TaxID=1983719 RepID=UPI001CF98296|nr:YhcN/YlaJ family sporulation lipoprotein [Bacillus shivajii]UCZ51870.1 YhcN/YlaJ family sporulation lipoprotein [Bacillus shivajii]
MGKYMIIFLLPLFLFIACQAPNEGARYEDQIETDQYGGYHAEQYTATDVANHLARLSTEVADVNRATAIVLGPYALVGIDVDGEVDQSGVGSIKHQVAEALADDPYGAQAAVTADPDIVNRIEEMRVEMGQGRPLTAIADELAAIVGRIIPVVPSEEHQQAEPLDSNEERTDPSDERDLEELQDEQSKGRVDNKRNVQE